MERKANYGKSGGFPSVFHRLTLGTATGTHTLSNPDQINDLKNENYQNCLKE